MKRRQTDLEKFSTFLESFPQGISGIGWRWKIEPTLRRNIKQILNEETIEGEILAFRFLNIVIKHRHKKSSQHLAAYLQEVAYWASKQAFQKYGEITSGITWEDYFRFANDIILQPEKLLSNYNKNSGTKITTYAQKKLEGQITNSAYSTMNWTLCSDWGLLRKISKKRLKNALEEIGGLRNDKLEQYLIIWDCFKIIYLPNNPNNTRKLPNPTEEQYQQITKQYNQMMVNKIHVEVVKNMLESCVEVARKYTQPELVFDPEKVDLPDDNYNYLDHMEEEEEKENFKEIKEFLLEVISNLSLEEKILLQLRYGLKINQTNIAKIFADNYPDFLTQQFQASRKIDTIKKDIIKSLLKHKLNKNKVKKEEINQLKIPCRDFIENYFQDFLIKKINSLIQDKKASFSEPEIQEITLKFTKSLIDNWVLKNSEYLFLKQAIQEFINTYLEQI